MIVVFCDFGLTGPYVGQMKARLVEYAPKALVIDLMCDAPVFDIYASAKLLSGLLSHMPKEGVFLCVVDPGVGGARRPVCLQIGNRWFVGPDNGLFQYVIEDAINADQQVDCFEIMWRPAHLSKSFHGRDLFAPVAAMLFTGHDFAKSPIHPDTLTTIKKKHDKPGVIYIDHYGNCWTQLRKSDMTTQESLIWQGREMAYAGVFCDTVPGDIFWYFNSSGFVEVAKNQGNAAIELGLSLGSLFSKT